MSSIVEQKFIDSCNKYASCKLILSAGVLSDLLRLIANEGEIYSVLENAAQGFNFREEFESAQIKTDSGYTLRLPQSKRALIALVASILYSFDNGSISILDFIEKFFSHPDGIKESFPLMCQTLVIPFRDAVVSVMRGEVLKREEEESIDALNEDTTITIPDGVVVHGGMILRSMNKLVIEDGSIESNIKTEYLEILDGAIHALEIRDVKLIRSFFVALCHVFRDRRALTARLKELHSCYKLYLLM